MQIQKWLWPQCAPRGSCIVVYGSTSYKRAGYVSAIWARIFRLFSKTMSVGFYNSQFSKIFGMNNILLNPMNFSELQTPLL